MRPLPCSRWSTTGSGTFLMSAPAEFFQFYVSFNVLQTMNTILTTASMQAAASRSISAKALSKSIRRALRAVFSTRVCIAVCAAAVKNFATAPCRSENFAYLCGAKSNERVSFPLSLGYRLEHTRAFFMPIHKTAKAVVSVTTFLLYGVKPFVRFGDHGNDSRFSVYNAKSNEIMSTITLSGATTRPSRKAISQSIRRALCAVFSTRVCIAVCAAAVASLFWQELTEQPVSPSLLLALPWGAALTLREERTVEKGGEV